MAKFLKKLIWLVIAVLIIFFSVENRHQVYLNIPYVQATLEVPAYFLFFLGLFAGIGLSVMAVSWSRLQSFVARRKAEREAVHLKTRLKVQDEQQSEQQAEAKYQLVNKEAQE